MGRTRSIGLVATVIGLVITLLCAGCGGDDGGNGSAGLENVVVMEGSEVDVIALDNSFSDQNIQVVAGTTVVWENKGRNDHDIVAAGDDGETVDEAMEWWVERSDFGPGEVYERTFDEPGTYRYYCSLHGTADAGMIGAVVVEEPADQ